MTISIIYLNNRIFYLIELLKEEGLRPVWRLKKVPKWDWF